MRLIIEIEMDNAAFEDAATGELRTILSNLWQDAPLVIEGQEVFIYDSNGNRVGFAKVED